MQDPAPLPYLAVAEPRNYDIALEVSLDEHPIARTNFREMSKQGLRPFIVGALGEVLIACLTLGLVIGANRIWGL